MSRTIVLLALVLSLGWSGSLSADEWQDRIRRENLARIETLIGMLASRNAAPVVKGNIKIDDQEVIRFPDTYDKSLQVPVFLAVQQLLAEGEWPSIRCSPTWETRGTPSQ